LAANAKVETLITRDEIEKAVARGYDRFHYVQQEWYLTNDREMASYRVREHNKKNVEAALKKHAKDLLAKNGGAGSRKPLKSEIAVDHLIDKYFSEDEIEEALLSDDPARTLRSMGVKSQRGWSYDKSRVSTGGDKVQIEMRNGRGWDTPFLMDLGKLAKRVLDKHAADAPPEAGLNWPPDRSPSKKAVSARV
jgi:hypothetical protein